MNAPSAARRKTIVYIWCRVTYTSYTYRYTPINRYLVVIIIIIITTVDWKKNNTLSERTVSNSVYYCTAVDRTGRAPLNGDVVASYYMLLLLLLCTPVTDNDDSWMIQTRLHEEIIIGNHRLHARAWEHTCTLTWFWLEFTSRGDATQRVTAS